eukprot:7105225-Pyramimonas_sp.AAC.1
MQEARVCSHDGPMARRTSQVIAGASTPQAHPAHAAPDAHAGQPMLVHHSYTSHSHSYLSPSGQPPLG